MPLIRVELKVRKDGYVQCVFVTSPPSQSIPLTGVKRFRPVICDRKEHEIFKGLRGGRYSVHNGCKNYTIPKKKGLREAETPEEILKRFRECQL